MTDCIIVNIHTQALCLYLKDELIKEYPVSTSIKGIGSKENSEKTPLGRHRIIEKIGQDAPKAMMFENKVSLNKTSRIYNKKPKTLDDDHIMASRILVLEGLEDGLNRGEGIDSKKRCIYIHGTPFEYDIGRPASHGCIRMKNEDIIELFDLIEEGIEVEIRKK